MKENLRWLEFGAALSGPKFAMFQRELTKYNHCRFEGGFPEAGWRDDIALQSRIMVAEGEFLEAVRSVILPMARTIPSDPQAFIRWYEQLKIDGPGQGDPLFPWLATVATRDQMHWFLLQEVAGEAGFEDLLATTQVKMPERAKLEMARNYWDEMGRGAAKGMHGPMLARLSAYFAIEPTVDNVVPESLALGNCMIGMAGNRRFAYHSIGALGVIEMTAPERAKLVDVGLRRIGVPAKKRHYFAVHAILDVKHSEAWNAEVLLPLVSEDPRRAQAIGEGALMRLWHGARCFDRYREELKIATEQTAA